jgi:hypothetical protein
MRSQPGLSLITPKPATLPNMSAFSEHLLHVTLQDDSYSSIVCSNLMKSRRDVLTRCAKNL